MAAFPSFFSRFPRDMLIAPVGAVLLMGALLWLGGIGLSQVVGHVERVANYNMEALVRIAPIPARLEAVNARLYRILSERAAGHGGGAPAAELDELGEEVGGIMADLAAYRDRYATEAQRRDLDALCGQLRNYQGALQWMRSMLEIDFTSAVSFIRPFNSYFSRLDRLVGDTTAALQEDARRRAGRATADARATGRWFLLLTVAAASGAVAASWATGRTQLRLRITATELESLVAARTAELMRATVDLQGAKTQAEKALADMQAAQSQLIEAEKMAALGSLVAGVAHEINTPIGSALTAASLLEERVAEFQEHAAAGGIRKADFGRFLETAGEACLLVLDNLRRAAELVHSFKQVAVDQASGACRPFNLRTCLDELLVSLRPRFRQTAILVRMDCPADLELTGYPGALSQVVTNLVMNSLFHAYRPGDRGVITIAAGETAPGTVELRYADDGAGIPADILPHVFEPFFTTRRGSGGTGLGLHIVYNNVTQKLGGDISIASDQGKGTLFVLTLPRQITPEG